MAANFASAPEAAGTMLLLSTYAKDQLDLLMGKRMKKKHLQSGMLAMQASNFHQEQSRCGNGLPPLRLRFRVDENNRLVIDDDLDECDGPLAKPTTEDRFEADFPVAVDELELGATATTADQLLLEAQVHAQAAKCAGTRPFEAAEEEVRTESLRSVPVTELIPVVDARGGSASSLGDSVNGLVRLFVQFTVTTFSSALDYFRGRFRF